MAREKATDQLTQVLTRLDRVLDIAERVLAAQHGGPDDAVLDSAAAFIWQRRNGMGLFRPVRHIDPIRLADLKGINWAITTLVRNTRQFLNGAPANHALLWGERGTGKSSAVKALLNEFYPDGLRLVQLHRHDLLDLPEIMERLWDRQEKYILFCDDLAFEADDAEYKELKALLEGGLHERPKNMLIYATSNRRHLMPTRMSDSIAHAMASENDEAHPGDTLEEQLSLVDRFGLRLGFYHIDQETYLEIVQNMVSARGISYDPDKLEHEALRWTLSHSSRSGRSARQFVDDLEGRLSLK